MKWLVNGVVNVLVVFVILNVFVVVLFSFRWVCSISVSVD